MKNKSLYLLSLLVTLFITVCSCKDDKEELPDVSRTITFPSSEDTNPTFSSEGGTSTISFTAGGDWTANLTNTRTDNWITIEPTSGEKGNAQITIRTTANETYDSRSTSIVLKCGNATDTVSVYQVSKDAIIIARNEYKFSNAGGELNFEIQSNIDFEVTTSESWIQRIQPSTRGLTEYGLSFNILPNEINQSRTGIITIKGKENAQKQYIYIKQIVVNTVDREALMALYKATNGDNWTDKTNWCSDKPLNEWHGVYTNNNDRVHIIDLSSNNLSGVLPDEIGSLQELESFNVNNNNIGGSIPESIGNLSKLETFSVEWNKLEGTIPKSIGKLTKLSIFRITKNNIEGSIPESIGQLTELVWFMTAYNKLRGTIPESIGKLSKLEWFTVISNNLSGSIPEAVSNLKSLKYFEIGRNNIEGLIPEYFADFPLLERLDLSGNHFNCPIPSKLSKCERWRSWRPSSYIFPQQPGYKLSMEDCYVSTDFSEDKIVVTLQTHREGNGIKLVLMGDMFVDTDVKNGRYEAVMKEAMESYFAIEPYKSLRKYFDVIAIKAVSKHDWMSGETAFRTTTSSDGGFKENYDKCIEYTQKAIGTDKLDNIQVLLAININEPGGGGHCGWTENGFSLATCVYRKDNLDDFKELIHHEAGGHGFGGLSDEYIEYEGTFTGHDALLQNYNNYGWNANIDGTSDPTKVRWTHFIKDPRYANEGIGVFEGAVWRYGIYRATENHIMREQPYAIDWFNAPSREAIYKRAMKLAYGSSWVYDYEKFVEFDAPARTATRSTPQQSRTTKNIKHVPPVIYNYPAVVK